MKHARTLSVACANITKEYSGKGGVTNMPNIKSAKKRVRVTAAKTLQNKMVKTQLKTEIKKYNAALEAGDMEAAQATYRAAVKKIDQAAAYGIIHKNQAAHKKSQFTKKLNAMGK